MEFLLHVVVTAGLLLLVAHWVKGFEIQSGKIALWSALVLGLVNGLVRPVLFFLTLPLTIL
ncbi:MAG: phage holin family protein, partial [Gemmatimonadales bacterium]